MFGAGVSALRSVQTRRARALGSARVRIKSASEMPFRRDGSRATGARPSLTYPFRAHWHPAHGPTSRPTILQPKSPRRTRSRVTV